VGRNLLPTAPGGVCVIDWEDCGPADPNDELASMLVEFGGGEPARLRAIDDSYLDSGGPGG
jgi:thiamine kinase-like enzyme